MKLRLLIFIIAGMLWTMLPAYSTNNISDGRRLLTPKEIVDTCYLTIGYYHRTYDPILETTRCPDEILLIGNNNSWYGSYGAFQIDSLVRSRHDMSREEFGKIYNSLDMSPECLIKDYLDDSYKFCGHIFSNYYTYQEKVPVIDWTLHNETDTVLNQICRKATCLFRGRKWTAWYANIPISDGPWMFSGLPGIILKLTDSESEHLIEAFEIQTTTAPFGMPKHLYIKTTREKYLKELKDYKNNPWKNLEMIGTQMADKDDRKIQHRKKKLFYNPIELE